MIAYRRAGDPVEIGVQLSNRDLAVIRSVDEHRFLMALHIEQLHFAGHKNNETGSRVCRRVLARLTELRFLNRLERRIGGVRAGSASFVYSLGPAGRRLVDGRRITEPSPLFLDHTLAVADAHVDLVVAARRSDLELVAVEVEPACWRHYVGAGGARAIVRPDLYLVTAQEEFEDCWFVEIDRGTESAEAIRRKCRAYELYWRTGAEQENHGTFPIVLWVAPNARRVAQMRDVIRRSRNLKQDLFRIATTEQLVELLGGGIE